MLLFGQQELYLGEDGEGGSAEERIRTLLGDADRGLARRRIRRPLGGSYQSQGLAERDREGGDSLNELLAHLTASRSGARSRDATDSTAALHALEKLLAEEVSKPSFAQQIVNDTTEHQRTMEVRSSFMHSLIVSLIAAKPESLTGITLPTADEIWGPVPAPAGGDGSAGTSAADARDGATSPVQGRESAGGGGAGRGSGEGGSVGENVGVCGGATADGGIGGMSGSEAEGERLLNEERARLAVLALPNAVRCAAANAPGNDWPNNSWVERLIACASVSRA